MKRLAIKMDGNELFLDKNDAIAFGQSWASDYKKSPYFNHIVFDNFLPKRLANNFLNNFPSSTKASKVYADKQFEFNKKAFSPYECNQLLLNHFLFFNSEPFLSFLESLTGIKGLISDPSFLGGGLHEIEKGGKLGIHADFRIHTGLHLQRRINVLIYLNKNWSDSYEGNLELWDKEMISCFKEIKPIFNKCVIFNTDPESYHGHPEPLRAPISKTRKSIALYYYTASKSIYDEIPRVTTQFQARNNAEKKVLDSRKKFSLSKIITNEILPPFLVKKTRKGLFYFKEYIKGRKK